MIVRVVPMSVMTEWCAQAPQAPNGTGLGTFPVALARAVVESRKHMRAQAHCFGCFSYILRSQLARRTPVRFGKITCAFKPELTCWGFSMVVGSGSGPRRVNHCLYDSLLTTRTDRNRQEPTGTDRNRQEPTGTDRNRAQAPHSG
jgi:hypothetical protein